MRFKLLLPLVAAIGLHGVPLHAADPGDARPNAAADAKISLLTGEQVIQILDETVDWYRTLGTQQQNASQPSDLLIVFANRQTADQVVDLAFELARANAELLSSEASAQQSAAEASLPQSLSGQQAQLDAQRASIQAKMKGESPPAAPMPPAASGGAQRAGAQGPAGEAARGKDKKPAEAPHPELSGQLAMVDARKNLLDTMGAFVNESNPQGAGANALKAQIDAIAATVPTSSNAASSSATSAPAPPASSPASATAAAKESGGRTGIWDLGVEVFRLREKLKMIEEIDLHTAKLAKTFHTISDAPHRQLKLYEQRSDALAAQANDASPAAQQGLRDQFDTLAWLFKQTSSIFIPLSKEQVLLQQYRHNLSSWKDASQRQYREALGRFGVRLGILLGILALVFLVGEAWRRAVVRFAHEPRRRYQLLLVQKIVMWSAVIAVIGLSIVTEISTFATFAGLLTAGVAVAMQSVLVSIVGYFFLIGKYGIRVGDRIQIGAVVGEVIDLGLVRMHLMELNQTGPIGPTGRVVAFPNLIVFQAVGGLFKQIPGVNLSWHETTLKLPAVSDYSALKQQLLAAVQAVVGEYREEIQRQTKEIERSTASDSVNETVPQVQMHLVDGHMEARIGYPVHLKHAAEIDERVSQALMRVIDQANA